MALEDPVPVVLVLEGVEDAAEVLDGVEAPEPEQVLLEDADEALDSAVALGLADEGRRTLQAEEVELVLEVVGHELRAVIVAQAETAGDASWSPPTSSLASSDRSARSWTKPGGPAPTGEAFNRAAPSRARRSVAKPCLDCDRPSGSTRRDRPRSRRSNSTRSAPRPRTCPSPRSPPC